MKEKASSYVVTYNSEKTIRQCLEALFKQSYQVDEVLVVDNGSSDKTIEIIEKFKGIRILRNKENNLAKARNLAVKQAKNDIILAVDSDIVLEKNWLRKALDKLKRNVVGIGGIVEETDKSIYGRWVEARISQNDGTRYLAGSNFLTRKSTIKKVGNYDEKYQFNYEDVEICERIKKNNLDILLMKDISSKHLKTYSLKSIMKMHWRYTFYDWPIPDNILSLFLKLTVNIYVGIKYLISDLILLQFNMLIIDIIFFFMQSVNDLGYFTLKK